MKQALLLAATLLLIGCRAEPTKYQFAGREPFYPSQVCPKACSYGWAVDGAYMTYEDAQKCYASIQMVGWTAATPWAEVPVSWCRVYSGR